MRISSLVFSILSLGSAVMAQQSALDDLQCIKFTDGTELALAKQSAFTLDVPHGVAR